MDPLEKFIRENREGFQETYDRKDQLWASLQKDLQKNKPKSKVRRLNIQLLSRAAGIIILIGVSIFAFDKFKNGESTLGIAANESNLEMMEIDAHYSKLINARIVQVKNSKKLSARQKTEFIEYLKELEDETKELEDELENNLNNDQIIQAIISNYKERLGLMEKLLDHVDNKNKFSNEKNISI